MEEANDKRTPGVTRRSFLKAAGFSAGALAVAGCSRSPAAKAIPLLAGREDLVPGRATWYATLCGGCEAGCGALAKVLDGRPIKLEGNPEHPVSRGGLCAIGQAQVLPLYDHLRLSHPLVDGREATAAAADDRVRAALAKATEAGLGVRVLTRTVTSPSLRAEIDALLAGLPDGRHVEYDADPASAVIEAHERLFGAAIAPRHRFDRARVIASFGADFLGAGVSPVEHTAAFAAARDVEAKGSPFAHLVQFEGRYTLTGGKADRRVRLAPGDTALALAHLAVRVAKRTGAAAPVTGLPPCPVEEAVLDDLAARLAAAPRGTALVVSGENDVDAQLLAAWLNHRLGGDGEGGTVDLARPSLQRRGREGELDALVAEMEAKKLGALLVLGANPVYDLPAIAVAMGNVPFVAATAEHLDETAAAAHVVVPDRHFLESWTDAEAVAGVVTLGQPALRPLNAARSAIESVAAWRGRPRSDREILRETFESAIWPRRTTGEVAFGPWFDAAVMAGFVEVRPAPVALRPLDRSELPKKVAGAAAGLVAAVHPDLTTGDGRHAENAWLQELPDPLTKVTWENAAALSAATAARLGVAEGDVVRLKAEGAGTIELPAVIQPGQHDGVVAIAAGYGRKGTERFATIGPGWIEAEPTVAPGERVGVDAGPLEARRGPVPVTVEKTGRRRELARTQKYDRQDVPESLAPPGGGHREVVRELSLGAYLRGAKAVEGEHGPRPDLWGRDPRPGRPRWGMTVDLAACTGCAACVVACQAENNVPVVGRDEVRRSREMHWIRVDRYWARRGADADLVHQPMMCQQCGHAPCETVCPVLATVHSEDGLNQQVYNRCVGTRYCANNCPYKVRRFNWFDYDHGEGTERLVLNPDVVVRERGVMEKCSFCVQRIRDAKARAREDGRPLAGDDVVPACAQSCPPKAIVFGDRDDPEGRLVAKRVSRRRYDVLGELGVKPVVGYLAVVRDREEA